MRLIDADEIPYLYPMDEEGNEGDGMTLQSTIDEVPTIEAIPIPKGATNGDIIKAMFPNLTFEKTRVCVNDYVDLMMECLEWDLYFATDWWNSPYKAESEIKE